MKATPPHHPLAHRCLNKAPKTGEMWGDTGEMGGVSGVPRVSVAHGGRGGAGVNVPQHPDCVSLLKSRGNSPPPHLVWGNFHRFLVGGRSTGRGCYSQEGGGHPGTPPAPGVPAKNGGGGCGGGGTQKHLDQITPAHSTNLFQICPNPSSVALGFVSLLCKPTPPITPPSRGSGGRRPGGSRSSHFSPGPGAARWSQTPPPPPPGKQHPPILGFGLFFFPLLLPPLSPPPPPPDSLRISWEIASRVKRVADWEEP